MKCRRSHTARLVPVAALCLVVGACGTPKPVADLADVTAANVSLVNTSLRQFARDSESVALTRAEAIKELDRRVTAARKELTLKLIAVDRAGQSDVTKTYSELAKLLEDLKNVEEEGIAEGDKSREATLEELITASRTKLTARSEPLSATSQALSNLAKDDDFEDKVKFYAKFIKGVVEDMKEARAASETAKADAEGAAKSTGALNSARDVSETGVRQ